VDETALAGVIWISEIIDMTERRTFARPPKGIMRPAIVTVTKSNAGSGPT
jgi:hypothetical protein